MSIFQQFRIRFIVLILCLTGTNGYIGYAAESGTPVKYPELVIKRDTNQTEIFWDDILLLELRGNRYMRFRSNPYDENWIGSEKSPGDLGWVYRDQGAKGMEVLDMTYENNPGKGYFTLRISGQKPQFKSKINLELTGIWMPEEGKFKYVLNSRFRSKLEDWYVHSKPGRRGAHERGSQILTEVLDYCVEGISIPERTMSPNKDSRQKPPVYEWFVRWDEGKEWRKWPKIHIPYPVRPGDYITIHDMKDPMVEGGKYGFLDKNNGGWITKIEKSPKPVIFEICWSRFDIHIELEGVIPPRKSVKKLDMEFEMSFEPVGCEEAREIVAQAAELAWRDAPEYNLPILTWDNRFDQMIKEVPSEETATHNLWWPSDYHCYQDITTGYDDHYSLSIKRPEGTKKPSAFTSHSWGNPFYNFPIKGKRLRFTVMVKTENCTGEVRLGHFYATEKPDDIYYGDSRSINADGTHNSKSMNWEYSRRLTGTNDWTEVTFEFTGQGYGGTLFMEATGSGQCWFDNARIELLEDKF